MSKVAVIDREKHIAYEDKYRYVIFIPEKKNYELRLNKRTHSLLIEYGTVDRCITTARKIAKNPHYFQKTL